MMRHVSEQEEQCLRVCLNLGQFYLDNPRDSPSDLEYACMALVTSKRITAQHVAAAAIALAEANRRVWDWSAGDLDSSLEVRSERQICRKALDAIVKLYAEQQPEKSDKPTNYPGPDKPKCPQHNYPLDQFGRCWCNRVGEQSIFKAERQPANASEPVEPKCAQHTYPLDGRVSECLCDRAGKQTAGKQTAGKPAGWKP